MLISCWSAKGGAGTTVVVAALGVLLARAGPAGAAVADLAGDLPAALGLPDPGGPGLAGWLTAGAEVPADGLGRLEVPVRPGLALLPRGSGPLPPARADVLCSLLHADPRPVVTDCGLLSAAGPGDGDVAVAVAAHATHSLLVLRPCFLALRRAVAAPIRPSGVVLVAEESRSITPADIEEALGVPVKARVRVTPQVARAVDAGLLAARLPRSLERDLRDAA